MREGPKALIVGAGPTGLVMAHELARDGIQCRLIDLSKRRKALRCSGPALAAPRPAKPIALRAVRGTEFDCTAGVALNQNYARGHEPLSAFRGEREGPNRRVGRVRWAAPQTGSSAGGEG